MILGLAGNKCDLFTEEQVKESEARSFAKEIGAVFHLTSCKESIGIDELFEECGLRFLESNNLIRAEVKNQNKNDKFGLNNDNSKNNDEKKKKCC